MATGESTGVTGDASSADQASFFNPLAFLAVAIWCGMSPIAKYALRDFPQLAYTAWRPIIAVVLMAALLTVRRQPMHIQRQDRARLAVAAIIGMGASQVLFIAGLDHTSVSHTVILISTSPLLASIYVWAVRRRPLEPRTIAGLLTGFVGVIAVVVSAESGSGASLLGDLLSLASAATWVLATMLPSGLVKKYGAPQITTWMMAGAVMVALPIGLVDLGDTITSPPGIWSWLSLIYNAVFGMLIANILWQRAVQAAGAARTLIYLYLEPIGAIGLAALFLGERLTGLQVIGAALAMSGVALVSKSQS